MADDQPFIAAHAAPLGHFADLVSLETNPPQALAYTEFTAKETRLESVLMSFTLLSPNESYLGGCGVFTHAPWPTGKARGGALGSSFLWLRR
jgi:hypothetical protein